MGIAWRGRAKWRPVWVGVAVLVAALAMISPWPSACSGAPGSRGEPNAPSAMANVAHPVPIPQELTLAGEPVPLHLFDVRESLSRELLVNTYWRAQTLLMLKRANRYFPIIEPILREHGVPDDFKYLAVAESALTHAVSPMRAVGFWQILEKTGKELGLEINDAVDERYHIELSTHAACRFLLRSYQQFGSWTLAAASYNMGRSGVARQIQRQEDNNYYDMVWGEETGRYIFRILALKVIFENPERYGFLLEPEELYPPIPTFQVQVDTAIHSLAQFARQFDTNYKILKLLNPWLRENFLPKRPGRTYTIRLPERGFRESAYR